ncbi:MAG: hypothetical protein K6E29_04985 [Cyanobacteria bacterium RUI128]|nr:hypothetical protein [Cyanobacteria bacterium RUI128]
MKIGFLNLANSNCNTFSTGRTTSSPAFCGNSPQKLIQKIQSTENCKHVHLSFDEVAKIYKYLGYDVLMRRGSHAIIPLNEKANLPLPIPHKDKYVSPFDIKRLKCIINGDIEGALKP